MGGGAETQDGPQDNWVGLCLPDLDPVCSSGDRPSLIHLTLYQVRPGLGHTWRWLWRQRFPRTCGVWHHLSTWAVSQSSIPCGGSPHRSAAHLLGKRYQLSLWCPLSLLAGNHQETVTFGSKNQCNEVSGFVKTKLCQMNWKWASLTRNSLS